MSYSHIGRDADGDPLPPRDSVHSRDAIPYQPGLGRSTASPKAPTVPEERAHGVTFEPDPQAGRLFRHEPSEEDRAMLGEAQQAVANGRYKHARPGHVAIRQPPSADWSGPTMTEPFSPVVSRQGDSGPDSPDGAFRRVPSAADAPAPELESAELPSAGCVCSAQPVWDMKKAHVLVVGAGFGGMKTARELCRNFRVTVVDCKDYFQYGPGVFRTFVDPAHIPNVLFPLRPVLESMGCKFIWGEVTGMDGPNRFCRVRMMNTDATNDGYCKDTMSARESVRQSDGPGGAGADTPRQSTNSLASPSRISSEAGRRVDISYDFCVIAAGCSYNKISQSKGESLWFPTVLSDIRKRGQWSEYDERTYEGRKKHIEAEYENLQKWNDEKAEILIVGAGFIGVEWTTEVSHYFPGIRIFLVSRPQHVLARWPQPAIDYAMGYLEKIGIEMRLGCVYEPERPDFYESIGMRGPPVNMYMCTGVQGSVYFMPRETLTPEGFKPVGSGWVRVNKRLQVLAYDTPDAEPALFSEDENGHGRCYALGDCSYVNGLDPLPKACYPSEEQGLIVSRIIKVIDDIARNRPQTTCCGAERPVPESHWPWGSGMVVLSLGPNDAAFTLGGDSRPGTGYTVLKGKLAALQKDFLEASKVAEEKMQCWGLAVWHFVHNTPVHAWGSGPLFGY